MTNKEKIIESIMLYPEYTEGLIKSLGYVGYNIADSILGRDVGIEFERLCYFITNTEHKQKIATQYNMKEFDTDYSNCDIEYGNINNAENKVRYSKLYKYLPQFKQFLIDLETKTLPAKYLGIHIHIDCGIEKFNVPSYHHKLSKIMYIISQDIFEYNGIYNSIEVGKEQKCTIINIRHCTYNTVEYRGGDCITDYTTIIYWILNCHAATMYAKYNNKRTFDDIFNITNQFIKGRRIHQRFID